MTDHQLAIRVTQASMNQTAEDWPQNMANHYTAVNIAVDQGSDMLLTQELGTTAYEVGDNFQRTDNRRVFKAVMNIASYAYQKDKDLVVTVGAPIRIHLRDLFENAAADPSIGQNAFYDRLNRPFNAQITLARGEIVGITLKNNLFNDERGYEGRFFNEYSMRDAAEVAKLMGIPDRFGTFPYAMPDGKEVPVGRPLIYFTDKNDNAFVFEQNICEEKWAFTKFDGYPYNDSRVEQLSIIPAASRYLGTTKGLFKEIANASPPSKLKQDKHMHLNNLASQYADVVVDTDGLGNSGSTFAQYGHRLISQNGETISAGERMQFGQVATTTSTVVINSADPALQDKTHAVIHHGFKNANAKQDTSLIWDVKDDAGWDHPDNPDRWIEEEIRNQALWTYDYMRKVGSNRAVNASSGGQDSGYNITMDYLGIVLAMHQIGVEAVCDDLNVPYKDAVMDAYKTGGQDAAIKRFMEDYLIMYYMPTNNNTDDHEMAARELSEGGVDDDGNKFKGLGGKFESRSIQDLVTMCALVFGVENTTEMKPERMQALMLELSKFVHASPKDHTQTEMKAWEERLKKEYPELKEMTSVALKGQSIAYENFQARLRTVLIWAAANVHGGSPRANPNLTEAYTNNTTAAGDNNAGGFNPNGGMFKDEEQQVLKYMEEKGLHGVHDPIRALRRINSNEPTAGLLPQDEDQTDIKTMQATMPQLRILALLMHHSKTLTEYGERELNFGEVYSCAKKDKEFSKMDENEKFNAVANFYRRWYSGQFKIHMGTIQRTMGNSVDHQTSRRTPNLNGGSKDEIILAAIDQMHQWAERDGLEWSDYERTILEERAWQDPAFVKQFMGAMVNRNPEIEHMHYDLSSLYNTIKNNGWDSVFEPLQEDAPVVMITADLEAA
jgi:NH3-dependent NAD+ synthetase